jgi:hypothetical protein
VAELWAVQAVSRVELGFRIWEEGGDSSPTGASPQPQEVGGWWTGSEGRWTGMKRRTGIDEESRGVLAGA